MQRNKEKNKTICFYDIEASSISRDADMISIGLVAVTEKLNPNWKKYRKEYLLTHLDKQHEIPEYIGNKIDVEVKTFYAEFTDFNLDKCDNWVKENVIGKLKFKSTCGQGNNGSVEYSDTILNISESLKDWLSQFEEIEFWADYDVIDKPMLIDLIADWNYSSPCGFISKFACHYEEDKKAYVCDRCDEAKDKDCTNKIGLPKHLPNIRYYDFYDLHTVFKIKGIDPDIDREKFSEVKQQVIPLPFSNYDHLKHNALWDAYISYLCYEKLMKI